jgi:hypothetical protein
MTDQNIEPIYFIGAVSKYPTPPLKTLVHRDGNPIADRGNDDILHTVFKAEGKVAEDIRKLGKKLQTARMALAGETAVRAEELSGRKKNPAHLRVLANLADLVYSAHEHRMAGLKEAIETLLTDRDALMTADNAHLAGYFTTKQQLYEVRQPLEKNELPSTFKEGAAHYRISGSQGTALPRAVVTNSSGAGRAVKVT